MMIEVIKRLFPPEGILRKAEPTTCLFDAFPFFIIKGSVDKGAQRILL